MTDANFVKKKMFITFYGEDLSKEKLAAEPGAD